MTTKSGKTFPQNKDDWKLLHPHLPKYISSVVKNGFRFIIISNQLGVSKGKVVIDDLKKKFESSVKALGVPCLILIATHDDLQRKPRTGLWDYLQDCLQSDCLIDLEQSFYVGDAAGRKKSAISKADFSCSDLFFASNCGIKFTVPEQFINQMANNSTNIVDMKGKLLPQDGFKPERLLQIEKLILRDIETNEELSDLKTALPASQLHCIIFCGLPASGKSSFYRNHLASHGYVHINCDTLKSLSKCKLLAKQTFGESKNTVVDNTNVKRDTRSEWIQLCKQHKVLPIIFYFKMSLEHVFHNNKFRKLLPADGSSAVPDVVIYTQNKNLEPPTREEGAHSVFIVNFAPKFCDDLHKKLYSMHLNEK